MTSAPLRIAVRDANIPIAAEESIFDALHQIEVSAIEMQIEPDGRASAVRLNGGAPFTIADAAGVDALKRRLASEHISVCALLLRTDFSSARASAHTRWAIDSARAAVALGAPVIRIDTHTHNRQLSTDRIRDNFVRCIEQVLHETADTGIDLGIENHGLLSNDPAFLDGIFAAVGDERLGMTLDTGNFYWYGNPLEEIYELVQRYSSRTRHTHIKNINYPPELAVKRREIGFEYGKYCCPLDGGNIDMKRIVKILRSAGYQRDLCIEDESLGKYPAETRLGLMTREAKFLRTAQIP